MHQPAFVRAEIILDTHRLAEGVRREWESLRPEDTVYLLAVQPSEDRNSLTNGHSQGISPQTSGLRHLRSAEIVQLLDDSGRPIRELPRDQVNGHASRQCLRRMLVNLDATQFKLDTERKEQGQKDIYESMNLIVRRRGRENNYGKILKTIQGLATSDVPIPSWLQDVFLGYGDPAGATYTQLPNRLERVDFRDTFLDWKHLVDSLPGKVSPQEFLTVIKFFLTIILDNRDCRGGRYCGRSPTSLHPRNAYNPSSARVKAVEKAPARGCRT